MWRWAMFYGDATGLVDKVTDLLHEQTQLLETASLLTRADLESYESRSEQIRELICQLAEK